MLERVAFKLAIVMAAMVIVLSLLSAGVVLYSKFSAGNKYRDEQQQVWHNVICLLESANATSKAPIERRREAKLYYDEILRLAHADQCPPATSTPR